MDVAETISKLSLEISKPSFIVSPWTIEADMCHIGIPPQYDYPPSSVLKVAPCFSLWHLLEESVGLPFTDIRDVKDTTFRSFSLEYILSDSAYLQ